MKFKKKKRKEKKKAQGGQQIPHIVCVLLSYSPNMGYRRSKYASMHRRPYPPVLVRAHTEEQVQFPPKRVAYAIQSVSNVYDVFCMYRSPQGYPDFTMLCPSNHQARNTGRAPGEGPRLSTSHLREEISTVSPRFHQLEYRLNYAPANIPTSTYPPVEWLIAPDIGGPVSEPSETMVKYMPVRRPTSALPPSAIIGADWTASSAPDDAP